MFTRMLKEHEGKQAVLKRENQRLHGEILSKVEGVSNEFVSHITTGASNVLVNQKHLELQAKALNEQSTKFTRQLDEWLALFEKFATALNEIGDFYNWSKSMEIELKKVSQTLDLIQKKEEQERDKLNDGK